MTVDTSGRSLLRSAAFHLLALLAAALAACGSGSDSDSESAYLQFATLPAPDGAHLQVWDPAAPQRRLVDVVIDGSEVHAVRRRQVDSAQRTWTEAEATQLVFTRQGQIYRVDLRGGQPHEPTALSTMAATCGIDRVEPLDAGGTAAVISTSTPIAPGNCVTGPLEPRLLRSDLNASSRAAAGSLVAVLSGDDAQASAVLVSSQPVGQAGRLSLLTAGLDPSDALQGGLDSAVPLWLGQDPAVAGLGYLFDGQALRALSWTPSGATLGGPLLTLPERPIDWRANAQALWIATLHGVLVRASAGAATQVADLPLGDRGLETLVPTDTRLLVSICEFDVDYESTQCELRAMPLSGGAWTTLYADHPGVDAVALVGAAGERPLLRQDTGYQVDRYGLRSYTETALRLLDADGSPGIRLGQGALIPVWAARHPIGQAPALTGALDCSAVNCEAGELRYRRLDGSATTLGSWTASGSSLLSVPRPLIEGLPGELQRRFPLRLHPVERYTVTPGTAGSLAPVK